VFVALSLWLIGDSVMTLAGGAGATTDLLPSVGRIAGGLALLAVYWWALWSQSRIRRSLENIFAIPELLRKIAFTLALLCIYRVGFHVPLPGLDQDLVKSFMTKDTVFGGALELQSMLTGGDLRQATLFGLGIMPYISAAIIFQLLTTVVPALEKLQKEGPAGQKKIQEYIRYATVGLCLVQAIVYIRIQMQGQTFYPEYKGSMLVFVMGVLGLTAGTIFLMWLGEQIDEYGIGNGISLLIMAGIVARLPNAVALLIQQANFTMEGLTSPELIGPHKVLFLAVAFVAVTAGAILITQGQRRIPIQQAKMTRGRRVYGGQRQYLPLRVNHGGVMPIIFASSLMLFPGMIFGWLGRTYPHTVWRMLDSAFRMNSYTYQVCYIALIFFFAYFWTTVQFRPNDMANQLRDYGSFIPGLRPGKRTAEYLERVMERITYCGAGFLALIAVIPMAVSAWMGIPFQISSFLGGTGLLIMISVALDLVQRIEANLVMRNYGGFLGGSTKIKGPR